MATVNPFDLLGDYDSDDPSQLIAARQQKLDAVPPQKKAPQKKQPQQQVAKLPSKPLPPAQAVREMKNDNSWGRDHRRGNARGQGGDGFTRDFDNNESAFSNSRAPVGSYETRGNERSSERRGYSGPRSHPVSSRRSGFNDGEATDTDRSRRTYERRSGTGRGNEFKREGGGRGNWGAPTDGIAPETEEVVESEKKVEKPLQEDDAVDEKKESPVNESEEKKPEEEKEMTFDEYQKVLEEKRKALKQLKTEERKVTVDKDFESMKQLSNKKNEGDVFVKLGSEKDKKKEIAEKEEKSKKSVSINEFLKPSEWKKYQSSGMRGRNMRGGFDGNPGALAPAIEDPGQFPTLGGAK